MSVTLDPRHEALIQEKVDAGLYRDVNDALDAALQLLDHHDKVARLRAALEVGLEDVRKGNLIPWTPTFMDDLIREAEEEDRLGYPLDPDVLP